MRTTLRLCWNPESAALGRMPVLREMMAAGMSGKAMDAMVSDLVECVAEVEIGDDGSITLLGVRRAERCRSTHPKHGLRCLNSEIHDTDHYCSDGLNGYVWPNLGRAAQAPVEPPQEQPEAS